jgi:hypothetical protein
MSRVDYVRHQIKVPVCLADGRRVGYVCRSTLVLPVQRSRHFFRQASGYSIDAGVLSKAESFGARTIQFIDKETGEIAAISVGCFRAHAQKLNFGWGPKLACPEKFYEIPGQLGLFDGGEAAYAPA